MMGAPAAAAAGVVSPHTPPLKVSSENVEAVMQAMESNRCCEIAVTQLKGVVGDMTSKLEEVQRLNAQLIYREDVTHIIVLGDAAQAFMPAGTAMLRYSFHFIKNLTMVAAGGGSIIIHDALRLAPGKASSYKAKFRVAAGEPKTEDTGAPGAPPPAPSKVERTAAPAAPSAAPPSSSGSRPAGASSSSSPTPPPASAKEMNEFKKDVGSLIEGWSEDRGLKLIEKYKLKQDDTMVSFLALLIRLKGPELGAFTEKLKTTRFKNPESDHYAWWVFPTEMAGASEPPLQGFFKSKLNLMTAQLLLLIEPSEWRSILVLFSQLMNGERLSGAGSAAINVLPDADVGRLKHFVLFWETSKLTLPEWLVLCIQEFKLYLAYRKAVRAA